RPAHWRLIHARSAPTSAGRCMHARRRGQSRQGGEGGSRAWLEGWSMRSEGGSVLFEERDAVQQECIAAPGAYAGGTVAEGEQQQAILLGVGAGLRLPHDGGIVAPTGLQLQLGGAEHGAHPCALALIRTRDGGAASGAEQAAAAQQGEKWLLEQRGHGPGRSENQVVAGGRRCCLRPVFVISAAVCAWLPLFPWSPHAPRKVHSPQCLDRSGSCPQHPV